MDCVPCFVDMRGKYQRVTAFIMPPSLFAFPKLLGSSDVIHQSKCHAFCSWLGSSAAAGARQKAYHGKE